jgi:hypothetical protein
MLLTSRKHYRSNQNHINLQFLALKFRDSHSLAAHQTKDYDSMLYIIQIIMVNGHRIFLIPQLLSNFQFTQKGL